MTPFLLNIIFSDISLFERIEYIRNQIPNAFIEISSNGILFEKYISNISKSSIDKLVFSCYGVDLQTYNYITKLDVSQEKFDSILKSFEVIQEKSKFEIERLSAWKIRNEKYVVKNYTSRGGFFSNNKIVLRRPNQCDWNRDHWLHILYDGLIPICCMDWRREEILGDVKNSSLINIVQSKRRNSITNRILGGDSKPDFICKRCEIASIRHI